MSDTNNTPNAVEATVETKAKRSRKSFDDAKAEQIATLEGKIDRIKKHLAKLEAELEEAKARKPKTRQPSEKAKAKKMAELLAKSNASEDNKRRALTLLGISDVEGLL